MYCIGKQIYMSSREAEEAAERSRARTGDEEIESYFCWEHGAWHLGHNPRSNQERDTLRGQRRASDRKRRLPRR